MPPQRTVTDKILAMARRSGIIRIRDVIERGIHPEYVRRLCAGGVLIRSGRGLYFSADAPVTANHTLAEACTRVPGGVICLLTALRFHHLTTQAPREVWMAIDPKARRPRTEYPPLRIMWFSGAALTEGIETHDIEGVEVKVFCPAKTVADCFKYRNKIGLDVAVEALRDCRRQRACTSDALWRYAKVCRVANVMRPHLEATL